MDTLSYKLEKIEYKQVRKIVFNIFKHKYPNEEQLHKVIDEVVYKNMEFKNYFYFWKFEIHDLKAKIKERLDYINRK
jgi:hypothetical protein